jgi:hypothetical protein
METKPKDEKMKIRIEQHTFMGSVWMAAWLFTVGFLHLGFWKGVLESCYGRTILVSTTVHSSDEIMTIVLDQGGPTSWSFPQAKWRVVQNAAERIDRRREEILKLLERFAMFEIDVDCIIHHDDEITSDF